ncbi:hypothetical protein L2E82_40118 [Cichorium intybus]|uniref:Uncharacterized protein n=1 Tax=Cichorium intybus TaxID=13427 RepID=A0ACB9AL27_CICIN|nr:hypothetical protein L2E82_40118 [Cichorium intybus]
MLDSFFSDIYSYGSDLFLSFLHFFRFFSRQIFSSSSLFYKTSSPNSATLERKFSGAEHGSRSNQTVDVA